MNTSTFSYAPVVIPTLCRYEHLKKCVESLSECYHAEETILYIALDFPAKESHIEGFKKIKTFLPSIKGFKDVVVTERTENLGAVENMNEIISQVFLKHDKLIFSEDDNVFAQGFLDFVNKALMKYTDDERIYTVSGYCYPVDLGAYSKNIFVAPNYSAWGVGYWREKYHNISRLFLNRNYARIVLLSTEKSMSIFKQNPRMLARLISMYWNNKLHTDTLIVTAEIVNGACTIFPRNSYVQNHGFDGSGENCWRQDLEKLFSKQPITHGIVDNLDEINVEGSPLIKNIIYNYFNPSKYRTIVTFCAYWALRIALLFRIR